MQNAIVWIIGLAFSCAAGHFIVEFFLRWLSGILGLPPDRKVAGDLTKRTYTWITGPLERLFFTIAVAANMAGVVPAMITWLVVKLAANWQQYTGSQNDEAGAETAKNYRFSALLGGFVSMLIALVSGLLILRFACR
jgi:hypothetical protein